MVSQILAITSEAPLGRWRMKSGSLLRNAMLVNSMMFNAEAWHGIVRDDIETLSRVDESLLRGMLNAHSKVPKEALFLELGESPLKFIWASRRLMYLQTILKRDINEITRRVYEAQKKDTVKGDFVKLVQEDATLIDYVIDENRIRNISKYEHHKEVKSKIRKAAFKHLQQLQQTHSKVRNIKYHSMKMQQYMSAPNMTIEDISLLFALRTRTVRGIRSDFGDMYSSDQCPLCVDSPHKDTIEALTKCPSLSNTNLNGSEFEDIFSNSVDKQREATHHFKILLKEREAELTRLDLGHLVQIATANADPCRVKTTAKFMAMYHVLMG